MKPEIFDVVIYSDADRKVESVIGKDMRRFDGVGSGRNTADLRKQTGLERVNHHYGVAIVPAGKYAVGSTLATEDME